MRCHSACVPILSAHRACAQVQHNLALKVIVHGVYLWVCVWMCVHTQADVGQLLGQ